jgi:hypothetical protein
VCAAAHGRVNVETQQTSFVWGRHFNWLTSSCSVSQNVLVSCWYRVHILCTADSTYIVYCRQYIYCVLQTVHILCTADSTYIVYCR